MIIALGMVGMASLCLSACGNTEQAPTTASENDTAIQPLVVYSSRKEHLVKPLFDQYTALTGQPIQYSTDKAGALIQRIKTEGENGPADLLFTVDAGNLWFAAEEGLLMQVDSDDLEKNVPAHLRDPQNRWFGLSLRARSLVYHNERVKPETLTDYAALTEPQWAGKLCLRTSKKVYNQSLVAMLIDQHGAERSNEIVKGWVANLAQPPYGSDTEALKAVLAGLCDVTVVNSYYLGRLLRDKPEEPLSIHWPTAKQGGVHVNISGVGIVRGSSNPAAALAFVEWLSSDDAQKQFAELNLEYPIRSSIKPSELVASWGSFEASKQNLAQAGALQAAAVQLMDRAGYR